MDRAATMPDEHAARVQGVMGQAIVNGTRRGVRSGMLGADYSLSGYNRAMIGHVERMGERMERAFAEAWQPMLGRWIVDAGRDYAARSAGVQERLGAAIIHVDQARTGLEEAWAANQYQLGTVLAAVDRTATMSGADDQITVARMEPAVGSAVSEPAMTWPGIPVGYLFAAMIGMALVFFSGLRLSAMSRESKMQAELRRDRERWVYRPAA